MCDKCIEGPDCRDHQIEVMVNHYCKDKMPEDGNWKKYNSSFRRIETTARGLAIEVFKGYSFCPVFEGRRRKENFVAAWHIGVDFDSGNERSTLDYLAKQDFINYYASFGYTTPSHTDEMPKARIIWVFNEPITDKQTYETLAKALLWRFPWADKAAKDALRLFFGSSNCKVWDNWSIFQKDAWQNLIDIYQAANPPQRKKETVQIEPHILPTNISQARFDSLINTLKGATDGEKHPELCKIAYTFGGYIAGGYFTESEVKTALRSVVDNDMANVKNYESAYRTIDESISNGQLYPIYFERPQTAGDKL